MPDLSSFLGLVDLDIIDEETLRDAYGYKSKILTCISNKPRPSCPHCDSRNVYANANRPKMIRDIDSAGYRITLKIMARNFKCNDCNKYFTEEIDLVSPNSRWTKRFVEEISQKVLNNTYDSIGANYGISPSTASGIFKEWVNSNDAQHLNSMYCPKILGIDEAHLCPKGNNSSNDGMRGVFVDVKKRKIIDMTHNRYKDTVVSWLRHINDNDNLEIVTMDMWDGYRQAVYEVYGDRVKVVVDRFHVIKELIEQMQKCRKNIYDRQPEGTFRNHRNNLSLLKTNLEDLTDEKKRQLNRLFVAVPDIKMCYALKESFRSIYRCQTKQEAMEAFERWQAEIPNSRDFKPYKNFARTVKKFYKEIFNFFDCGRVTNATTESLNAIVKKINREGNGYSFEVLRAKIIYGAGRRAYTPVRRNNVSHTKPRRKSGKSFEEEIQEFGVDIDWLSKEVDSGDFFRKDLKHGNKNNKSK